MRIGFITQWFPPEAGTIVASAIADGLAERGHQVDVLTGFPNYPTGVIAPGYRLSAYMREHRSDRVTVHRAPLYPSHDSSASKRMANYLSFSGGAVPVAQFRMQRPDAWLVYSSPATAALPALVSHPYAKPPMFLIIQDLWPDSVTGSGFLEGRKLGVVNRCLSAYCNLTYRRARGIGVISPGMRSILHERGVPEHKIFDTPNWVADDHVWTGGSREDARRDVGLTGPGRIFMYAGNIGDLQGLRPLVAAFARVPEAQLVLVGDGVARRSLQRLVLDEGIRNVTFEGHQPTDRIGRYIAASDVQIVSLRDSPLLRATMPSKVQSSLAAGRPILAHAAGDVADLVSGSNAGLAAVPGDIAQTVEQIRRLAEMDAAALAALGENARALYERRFSPAVGVDNIEAMLASAGLGKERA